MNRDYIGATAIGHGLTDSTAEEAYGLARNDNSQVLRDIDNLYSTRMMTPSPMPAAPPYVSSYEHAPTTMTAPSRPMHQLFDSQSSNLPLIDNRRSFQGASHQSEYQQTIPADGTEYRGQMPRATSYHGDGYDSAFDPDTILDDGDDGFESPPRPSHRESRHLHSGIAAGAATGVASGGTGGLFKAFGARSRDASGSYGPVAGHREGELGPNGSSHDAEKSEWLQHQTGGNKRLKWIVGSIIAVLVIGAIIGGVVGGVLASKKSSNSNTATSSEDSNGLFDINSSQVQALLQNDALHRVFPGIDYTPLNAQYPGCLTVPPDQNNITLDVAMLAQLTPTIRLYGTDCNQTEMLLTAIDRLGYNDTIKVWIGVWLGTNATTNSRQLEQMYTILDTYPSSHFSGVIVGNEVLFRQDMTITQLGTQLEDVRQNLTAKNIDLPVATSDLGNDWTAGLAADTDIVMANVHPFFAGVTPDVAPAWTWEFWQTHDVVLTGTDAGGNGSYPRNIIAETGWPSAGGNDCGTNTTCPSDTAGSVASVDNMNTFLGGWVCQALANGTTYFWFEAFDEPWKVIFDTPTDNWESKWGLMDSNRNVKDGLIIPDCGGKTAGSV